MNPLFQEIARKSLDNDLQLFTGIVEMKDLILLQMLRIMRGRPFHIDLQPSQPSGWSPDGKTWFPSQPGTFTTGSGPIPPEMK